MAMLIQELFSAGIMRMGPARNDPERQVGVFNPDLATQMPVLRAIELQNFKWLVGDWCYENSVPSTPVSSAFSDIGNAKYAISGDGNWLCLVGPDGRETPQITFDPISKQWIYALLRGSYGILRSTGGWCGDQIIFSGSMTMVGINCEWRMRWTLESVDRFSFVNEEGNLDGSWSYVDEWRFRREN
jgi:hypothetical protein